MITQSFAAIFERLGREEESEEDIKRLQTHRDEAREMGITLNDMMEKSKFLYDQGETVLNAIRRSQSDYTPPGTKYQNPLLTSLNKPL